MRGPLTGSREGAEFSRGSGPESREQPLHTAPAAILTEVGVRRSAPHTASLPKGLKFQVQGLSLRPLRASETRLSTKDKEEKRLDFIFLPGFYFYFSGIVNAVYWFKPKYFTMKGKYIIFLS